MNKEELTEIVLNAINECCDKILEAIKEAATNIEVAVDEIAATAPSIQKLKEENNALKNARIRSCVSCGWFSKEEKCTYKGYNMRPPAEIIANGCKNWFDVDGIPF